MPFFSFFCSYIFSVSDSIADYRKSKFGGPIFNLPILLKSDISILFSVSDTYRISVDQLKYRKCLSLANIIEDNKDDSTIGIIEDNRDDRSANSIENTRDDSTANSIEDYNRYDSSTNA
jgi:hypothetical protein